MLTRALEAADRAVPWAAPHPNPLPVALGIVVSAPWMARGRREGKSRVIVEHA